MANGNGFDPEVGLSTAPSYTPVSTTVNDLSPGMPNSGAVMDPAVSNQLVKTGPLEDKPDPTEAFSINDISKQTNIGNRYGAFAQPPVGMIIHHTGPGYSTGENLGKFFNNTYDPKGTRGKPTTGVASQFTIDRDGNIFQLLPDGMRGQHIQPGWGAGSGLNNGNVEGVEIMANGDKDVLPVQQRAAAWLVGNQGAKYGWNPQQYPVWGHGEVNPGHKEADEGMTVANGIRNGTLVPPTFPTQGVQPRPMYSMQNANQLGGVTVPQNIAPFLNYWADYYGLDRGIFSRMIKHESSFVPDAKGTSGEIGLGQLMPGTASDMGVTDRADINQNLMGSAKYLRQMLDDPRVQGDYRKGLMLYNSGPNVKTPFQNTSYADAVLSGQAGGTAGPGPPRTPMQVAGGAGGYEADLPPNWGKTAPGTATPNSVQSVVDRLNQKDVAMRRLQMMQALIASYKPAQIDPKKLQSGYDPEKVREAGQGPRVPSYTTSFGSGPTIFQSTVSPHPYSPGRSIEVGGIPSSTSIAGGPLQRRIHGGLERVI